MAARAHNVAALAFAACLNFADSTWRLPTPTLKDAVDVRRAVVEAAKAFSPHELQESVEASDGEDIVTECFIEWRSCLHE
ncbi:hypothetical protein V6N13_036089 [Hibiscus sabdariffa]|uniref:Uncharacterized protein n=1 Tax=Hibiscus sabdariffa TaxID=183260 RepID=A0ABR2S7K9_9ROSI